MDMMLQMIYDNKRRKAQLEEELATAESVVAAVRKKLRHVVKHGKSLEEDYGNGEATLPLAPPDDDEEEEATDEADDADGAFGRYVAMGSDPAEMAALEREFAKQEAAASDPRGEHEIEPEPAPAEPEKPIRRRKARAVAEE